MTFDRALPTGVNDGRVSLVLGDQNVALLATSYEIRVSVLQQPAAFSLRLGGQTDRGYAIDRDLKTVGDIVDHFPPGIPFELRIGSHPQFLGQVDGYVAERSGSGGTALDIRGRDFLAKLHDHDLIGERQFKDTTYDQLVRTAMKECGLGDRKLTFSNSVNRKFASGTRVAATSEPVFEDVAGRAKPGSSATAKMGESWLTFLERQLAKHGLFIWADALGGIVVAQPNGIQNPTFDFHVHARTQHRWQSANVTHARMANDTTRRFSEVVIYARNYGRKFGHNPLHGGFKDHEMDGYGFRRARVYRDVNVATIDQAEFFARCKVAEANRTGFHVEYTFSGHTAPALTAPYAVLRPDLVANVRDEAFGLDERMYIESVVYRGPPRTTTVTLMRTRDLVFGGEPE